MGSPPVRGKRNAWNGNQQPPFKEKDCRQARLHRVCLQSENRAKRFYALLNKDKDYFHYVLLWLKAGYSRETPHASHPPGRPYCLCHFTEGSKILKTVPFPGALSTRTLPWWLSIILKLTIRPSPLPFLFVVKKGCPSFSNFSSDMPLP